MFTQVPVSERVQCYVYKELLVESQKKWRLIEKNYIVISTSERIELGYPQEQFSVIIMDTFNGQDNEEIKSL